MYVVVDRRRRVTEAPASSLASEGAAQIELKPQEIPEWGAVAPVAEANRLQGAVGGEPAGRADCSGFIRKRTRLPDLVPSELSSLTATLELLSMGADGIARAPVRGKEIAARSNAVWRRINRPGRQVTCGRMKIYFDGRSVEIDGEPMTLPRREQGILEFLARNAHRRVTKTQIFSAIYGPLGEAIDEVDVGGHISRLRRKLRMRLGRDVIDAKRTLGYQFVGDNEPMAAPA